jgi:hypothetical protein
VGHLPRLPCRQAGSRGLPVTCVRHPAGDGPAWCMDCHPERYEKYRQDYEETPPPPPPLPESLRFDAADAKRAGQRGMSQAESAQRIQLWKHSADDWLEKLASDTVLVADDLIATLGLPDPAAEPATNNVVGAVFSGWSRKGLIEFTGHLRKSERVIRHGNLQRVWRKL